VGTLAARPGGTPEGVIGEGVPVRAGGQPSAVVAQGVREQRAGRGRGLASCVGPARSQDAHPQRQMHLCMGRNCGRRAQPGCPNRVIRVNAGSLGKPQGSQRGELGPRLHDRPAEKCLRGPAYRARGDQPHRGLKKEDHLHDPAAGRPGQGGTGAEAKRSSCSASVISAQNLRAAEDANCSWSTPGQLTSGC